MSIVTIPRSAIPNLGTGEYRIIVPRGRRTAAGQRDQSDLQAAAEPGRWWRGAGAGFTWSGFGGLVAAGFLGWIYALLTETTPDDAPARVLAIGTAITVSIGSLMSILLGCKARSDDRAQRAAQAELIAKLEANAAAIVADQGRAGRVWDEMLGEHVGRLARLVHQRLGELEQRMKAIETRRVLDEELLRGLTAWAMDIDQRLAQMQQSVIREDAADPGAAKGHSEVASPLELSDEALRGYFMGFYDREREAGSSSS